MEVDSGDKIDFWMLSNEPFDQSRFQRRQPVMFRGQSIFVSQAEDTILMKLRWAQLSGGSDKQMGDALGVYAVLSDSLDQHYLEQWADHLGVTHLLKLVRENAAG